MDHLTGDSATPGKDWTIVEDLRDVNGFGVIILGNTGSSGTTPIFIGFNLIFTGDGTHYPLCYRVFRTWTAGAGTDFFTTSVGNTWKAVDAYATSGICCAVAMGAGGATLFCNSNKGRIVLAHINGGRYSTNYIGFFLPWALPSEYPNPVACFGDGVYQVASGAVSLCSYDSTETSRYGSIWFPNGYDDGDDGTSVSKTYGYRRCHSIALPGNNFQMAEISNATIDANPLVYYTGAPRLLLPLWVTARVADSYQYLPREPFGQLDGVYWCPDPEATVGGTVTVDGTTYRVFPENRSLDNTHFIAVTED